MRISGQGVLLSLAASVLFVTLPGYVHLLEPLDSLQVVAHRVVWSIPMVFLLVVATRQWPTLRAAWCRLFAEPWLLACFPLTAAMMLLQWGIFIWAPLAGKTLELSLGYFLLPLAMVLVGRVFYGERLTPLQAIAVACALAGVLHEFWLTRAFSWVSLVTALGYPPYFMLRRRMGVDALSGFVFEMLFLLPLALAALYWLGDESQAFGPSCRAAAHARSGRCRRRCRRGRRCGCGSGRTPGRPVAACRGRPCCCPCCRWRGRSAAGRRHRRPGTHS